MEATRSVTPSINLMSDWVRARASTPVLPPYVCVDQSLGSQAVQHACGAALSAGWISGAGPVWAAELVQADGEPILSAGSTAVPGAAHVKGRSWPDLFVVKWLTTHWHAHDRLVLLTADRRGNAQGLGRLLHEGVRPVLELPEFSRLGLTVFRKDHRKRATIEEYCVALLERLKTPLAAGFVIERLP